MSAKIDGKKEITTTREPKHKTDKPKYTKLKKRKATAGQNAKTNKNYLGLDTNIIASHIPMIGYRNKFVIETFVVSDSGRNKNYIEIS